MRRLYLAMVLLFLTGGLALADSESGIVKLRQNYMDALGGHMGAIGGMMKLKMNDPEHLAAHALGIQAAGKHLLAVFPEGSKGGKAKDTLWKKWDDFKKKAADFQSASDALVVATGTKDMAKIGPAIGTLGDSCKACHKSYKERD